jgi:hypothetical protein
MSEAANRGIRVIIDLVVAEANVPPDQMLQYFGDRGTRMNMVLNFFVNPHIWQFSCSGISKSRNQRQELDHGVV